MGSIQAIAWFEITFGCLIQFFEINNLELVDQNSASWNRIAVWLRQLDLVRLAA